MLLFCLFAQYALAQTEAVCEHPDAAAADAFYDKGKKAREAGKVDSLIVYMKQARALYEKAACWEKVVQMTRNLCVGFEMAKKTTEKQEAIVYGLLVSQMHLPDSSAWKGKMFRYVGADFLSRNMLDSAKNYLITAKHLLHTAKDWKEYVSVCKDLARMAYFKENFDNMEAYLDEAFDYNHRYLKDDKEQIKAIFQLYGALYYRTGAFERALEKHLEGLEYASQNINTYADSVWLTIYYNNIGLLYMEIGDIYKTQDYCENALYLARQLKNYNFQVTAHLNLAEFFKEKGQYLKAYDYYQKGLETVPFIKNNAVVSQSEKNRAFINLNNGLAEVSPKIQKTDTAKIALQRNLKMHKVEPFRQEDTYRILGETYIAEKNYKQAQEALEKSLQILQTLYPSRKHPEIARVYKLMGKIQQELGSPANALSFVQQAENALMMQYTDDMGATDNVKVVSDKRLLLDLLFEKAKQLRGMNRIQESMAAAQEAIRLVEELRTTFKSEGSKLFLSQQVIPIYEFTVGLLLEQYDKEKQPQQIEEAFRLVELGKALLLLDALKTEEARRFGGIPDEILEEENRLSREIAKAEKKLVEAQTNNNAQEIEKWQKELLLYRQQKSKLEKTLEENPEYKEYYELKYSPRMASLKEVQAALPDKTMVTEFFIGNENVFIFYIYNDKIITNVFPKDTRFESHIYALRQALTDSDFIINKTQEAHRRFCTNASALYEICLSKGLEGQNVQRIVFIPDGLLNYIPFEVLLTKMPAEVGTKNFKNLDYLLKHYTVHYHYSASLMLFERKGLQTNGSVLAFAPHYPQYSPSQVDPQQWSIRSNIEDLPGAQQELKMLEEQFYGDFFYKDNAHESKFKQMAPQAPYSVIHLAMHGWINNERPQYSSLVFSYAADSTDDDLLHAYELNLLKINADLVVLSACETGFGKYERGEGVVSIGRGFMYAGVPSLLMTLWPINDQATASIMTEFYHGLSDGLPKDEARRKAQLKYLESQNGISCHPFFWASFISLGNEQPITLHKRGGWAPWLTYGGIGVLLLLLFYYIRRYFTI